MPQYVAMLKSDRVAVLGEVKKQAGGHFTVQLLSWVDRDGAPEPQHPEKLSISDRDLAGKMIRAWARTDGIAGPWS